jgi:hypothetical protein
MLGYRENDNLVNLLGMRVGVSQPGDMTVNGLLFITDDDSKFIDKTKKCKGKLSVPNFNTELFRQCVDKLQPHLVFKNNH